MAVTFVPQILPLDSDANATTCLNTGCAITLVDKACLLRQLANQRIKGMSILLKVRERRMSKHESAQFAKLSFFFLEENDKWQKVYTFFRCKLHLVKGFRANILIGNNILAHEDFILDVKLGHAFVRSCGVKITI